MEVLTPIAKRVISDLKAKGIKHIGCIGYCWGGRLSMLFGCTDDVSAYVAAHPSKVAFPADIEKISKPGLYLCAEVDGLFNDELREKTKAYLSSHGKSAEFVFYPGTSHGFAVRGNSQDETVRKAREDACHKAADFFKKHLS
mmetsp:Transcript_12414/g.20160  ORF Transcript_12414/g.20160 Transcript_12414/m.20160 type:complete len:142 (-) Transcript_12414:685-1110(-)